MIDHNDATVRRVMQRAVAEMEHFLRTLDRTKFIADGRGGEVAEVVMPGSRTPRFFGRRDVLMLKHEAKATLWAQARHAASNPPSWTLPLPTDEVEVAALLRSSCPPMKLLGLFAQSSAMSVYDPHHVGFSRFASGVMAHRACPSIICNDLELRTEFPAKPLPKLSDKLVWYGWCDGERAAA